MFAQEMQVIFEAFGKMQSLEADHPDVQAQVANLQAYITENFYTCTKEILQNLGLMYVEDERFTTNIDRAGDQEQQPLSVKLLRFIAKNKRKKSSEN
ncbi:TPA: TipAS antibiotic-recognition domain-containing protein [Streptococcus suis]